MSREADAQITGPTFWQHNLHYKMHRAAKFVNKLNKWKLANINMTASKITFRVGTGKLLTIHKYFTQKVLIITVKLITVDTHIQQ